MAQITSAPIAKYKYKVSFRAPKTIKKIKVKTPKPPQIGKNTLVKNFPLVFSIMILKFNTSSISKLITFVPKTLILPSLTSTSPM